MAKIHITLVGGQTTPVYQGILHVNPDRVFLIHSQQSENEANRIYVEVDVNCELRRFDPVDLSKINNAILNIKNSLSETDDISINVSSGTKMWSLLFYSLFVDDANATLFVIDQNNKVWNLKTHECTDAQFDMDVQFRLLGNELKDYREPETYTEADKSLINEIRELRKFNYQDFNQITDILYRFPNQTEAFGKGNSFLRWDPKQKHFEITMRNRQGFELQKTLFSDHVRELLLNTRWFEFEIATLLSGWEKTRQLRMYCVFNAQSGSPKNEIDIIINTGNKLLFVECKTQIKNETDIDKFASAVKVYGGLGSKALFVTDAPMTEKAREKCSDHGVMTFCLQDNSFNLPVESLLFKMLDDELDKLNLK